jgi:hypothetical protein
MMIRIAFDHYGVTVWAKDSSGGLHPICFARGTQGYLWATKLQATMNTEIEREIYGQ